MKPTLLFTTLSMILATSPVFAKSELETLRSLCAEQERQIRQLEVENSRLRSDNHEAPAASSVTSSKAASVVQQAETTATSTPSTPSTYTVKAGDSFGKIARKLGTSSEKLAKANGLKTSAMIHPGQKLKTPGVPARSNSPEREPVAQTAPSTRSGTGASYTIRPGDTYSSISKKHGVSTAALIAANPKVKPTALRPGLEIRLGGSSSSTTMISAPASHSKPSAEKSPAPAPTPVAKATESIPAPTPAPSVMEAPLESTPAPAVEKETASSTQDKKFQPVTIDGEMTYGEFAAKHGTDAERLNALNGLDLTTATVLAKGSELYVPAQP